jgi:2'-5' RNA ligase
MARDRAGRPEAKGLRLFVAFDLSPAAMDVVEHAIEPWRRAFPKARWVPRENWHVTLKFLGQTWPRLEAWVRDGVGASVAACSPVASRLTTLGGFPSSTRARVLWAGMDDGTGGLARIAAALDDGLRREFSPESRRFSPHLTVARSDPPLRVPDAFSSTPIEPVSFTVGRIVLYRSHLQRPAPRYEPMATFPLGLG